MKGTAGSPLVKKVSHLCEFTSAWVTVGEGFRGEWGVGRVLMNMLIFTCFMCLALTGQFFSPVLLQ